MTTTIRHLQDYQIGPIAYAGMRTVAKIGSVQTTGAQVVSEPKELGELGGPWQWLSNAAPQPEVAALFRQSFSIDRPPARALVRVVSDQRYRLFVNGRLASRGPADVGRDCDSGAPGPWLYEVRDVTAFLTTGKNVISLEVFKVGLTQNEGTSGHPGFLIDTHISPEGRGWERVETPWRGIAAPQFQFGEATLTGRTSPTRFLQVDLTKEPLGWQGNGFDDEHWPLAVATGDHWATPLPSEIPPSGEALYPATDILRTSPGVTIQGRQVQIRGNGDFAVRFDRVLSAHVQLKIHGVAGTVVTVMPNEPNEPGFHRAFRTILREGYQTVELPYFDSFSVINVEVRGVDRSVVFESLGANFISYPVQYKSSFECSDAALDKIWTTGRWVTQICMQTHHLDSPHHQEPISDPGDYLIEALVNYYTFGEPGLARQDLIKFGRILRQRKYVNFHLSYALLWLQMLQDYRQYTGDLTLEKELASTVYGLLDTWRGFVGKNGVISEAPNYMFMDWVELGGFTLHHPPAVIGQGYITALYFQALGDEQEIAARQGDTARAARAESDRNHLREAFEKEFWFPERNLYHDGRPHQSSVPPSQWLPADTDIETFSPHVNVLAVATGLATGDRAKRVLSKVLGWSPLNCQPYFMHFVFDALHRAGLFHEYAATQMRRWQIVPDTQSFREMWTTGDLSHAWIATPTYQLSSRVLGATPTEPGWKAFEIAPTLCGLRWARGTVPTPHGEIRVRWEITAAGVFDLHFTVPVGTSATVVVPTGYTGKVELYRPGIHRLRFAPTTIR